MLRVAIAGCHGRMGKAFVQAMINEKEMTLTAATVSPNSPLTHTDVGVIAGTGALQLKPSDNLETVIDQFDILVDFTNPISTLSNLEICRKHHKKIVIGATGFSNEQKLIIQNASKGTPIVLAPNMSIGMNLCFELLKQAAEILGDTVDIEIIEAHHRNKIDAPSGAALKMGEVLAETLNRDLNAHSEYGRHGISGTRDRKTIGFSSIRAGDIVGNHTVLFAGEGEQLEITHRATDRSIFAKGAVRAAKWLSTQSNGLYSMQNVLFNHTAGAINRIA